MNLRRLMFVLPNLFTLSSIFCSFYALTLCSADATPQQLYQASLAIFFAMFFDAFDGRVARLTRTQSQFGVELDSLADVISFGVVPALLVYRWALSELGPVGFVISFAFAACGALRLARFNVVAQRSDHAGSSRFFTGLPIPLAAGVVISMVIAHHGAIGGDLSLAARVPVAVFLGVLALLMVSTVRYRTFKDLRFSRRSLTGFVVLCVSGLIVATQLHPAFVLFAYFGVYLTWGLFDSALMLGRRLGGASAVAGEVGPGVGAPPLGDHGLEDDELEDDTGAESDPDERYDQEDYL